MSETKPKRTSSLSRDLADITEQIERLNSLLGEFLTATPEHQTEMKTEIEALKEKIERFALRYRN